MLQQHKRATRVLVPCRGLEARGPGHGAADTTSSADARADATHEGATQNEKERPANGIAQPDESATWREGPGAVESKS